MKQRGYVHLVGIGPGNSDGISVGALRAIQEAEEIWGSDIGPTNRERLFLRPHLKGKKIVNLNDYYQLSALPRQHMYRAIAARAAYLASRGRKITFLFSGNPMVWVDITDRLKHEAAEGRLDLRITPSMSFLDVIWTSLPFSLRGALQVRASLIDHPDISPEIDCVVGQVGDPGTTGGADSYHRFVANLHRLYPAGHTIYVTGSDPVYDEIQTVPTTVANLPSVLGGFVAGYYVVVIPRL